MGTFRTLGNNHGVVLVITIVTIMMLVLLAGFVLAQGYNRKLLSDTIGGGRMAAYYHAKAGVVDAEWRIRTNTASDIGGEPGNDFVGPNDFTSPEWNPDPYSIDLTPAPGEGENPLLVILIDEENPQIYFPAVRIHFPAVETDQVTVDIGAVDQITGLRPIEAIGRTVGGKSST